MVNWDAEGIALAYLQGGCAALVCNLWDVTDGDIDRFCGALLQQWLLDKPELSLAAAIPAARQACRLKYLTGAAPVCYGVPVHLVQPSQK